MDQDPTNLTSSRIHFILPAWDVGAPGHHKGESSTSEPQLVPNMHTTNFASNLYALISEPTDSSYGIRNLGMTPSLSLAILELTQVSLRHRVCYPRSSSLIHLFPSQDSCISFVVVVLFSFLKFAYFSFMHTRVLPACTPRHHVFAVPIRARRWLMVASCHVLAGNQT